MAQQVSDFEMAHVVLAYLETKGWVKTAASFQREAKAVFKSGRRPHGRAIMVLDDLVNAYLQSTAREAQRVALGHVNPLAAQIYSLLDMTAGLPPLPMPHLPQQMQQQQPAEMMGGGGGAAAAAAAANVVAAAAAAAAAGGAMVPIAEMGGCVQPHQAPEQPSQRPATTPGRHAQRKGAPQRKRRRLDAEFEAARPVAPLSPPDFPNSNEHSLLGDVPFGDLLYRAVDPAAVMQVLDHEDEALNKFSSLLADNINRTAMGADNLPEAPDMLFTDLLQDPEAQEIVRRLVGTAAEGDGGGMPALPLPRPQSGEGEEERERQRLERLEDEPRPSERAEPAARGRPRNGAAAAAEGDGGAPQDEDDVRYYKENPDELEDLLDDIVG